MPEVFSNFWNGYVLPFSSFSIDSGTDLSDGRFFMRWAYIFTRTEDMFAQIVTNCLFGALTVLLQALPVIDYEYGRVEALGMLGKTRAVVAGVSQSEDFAEKVREAEALGWQVQSIYRALQSYDALLGTARLASLSMCAGPKIYVYPPPGDTGGSAEGTVGGHQGHVTADPTNQRSSAARGNAAATLLHSGGGHYLEAMMQAPLQCLFGMYGTELLFHNFFASSGCRVLDPEDADLFYVPSYFKCIEVINFAEHFNADEDEASVLFGQTLAYIQQAGPWFRRHDGADHIFLFSWGKFPCRLPSWREALRSAISIQVEDHCEDLNTEEPQSSFCRWKDIIIPGHVDHFRALDLRGRNLPFEQRDVLLAFHGRHAGNSASYANVSVRTRIVEELGGLPGVSVGGFIEEYHELLGRSVFCLAPRGITPWTIHLYVATFAGCIPVILSDDFEVPFQGLVDWPSLSIKWPTERAGGELHRHLSSLPPRRVQKMKLLVDKAACWFDYYSTSESCSPFVAVQKILTQRHQQRPTYVGQWWND